MAERGRDQAGGWRHPGWAWTARRGQLISAASWIAGLLAAFALGNVPSLVTGDWKAAGTWVSLWLSVGATLIAAVAFGFAATARRGRDRMIAGNGTAYLIQERARFWDDDNAARFRAGIHRQFARVIQVPGPVEAGRGWDWSLDGDAWQWDAKCDELVRAFRVLSIDKARDGTVSPDGVFLWAHWAVAAAFGMRVTAADRDLVLDVWQRPSRARAGEVEPEIWAQRPLHFTAAPATETNGPAFSEHLWPATLDLSRVARQAGGTRRGTPGGKVSVLLVRFSTAGWGPLPAVAGETPADPLTLRLSCAVSALPPGSLPGHVHELRCVPPAGPSGAQFPWQQFPALAAAAVAWIGRKAKELDGHTLLLGTVVPQEVGLGLGILAGQESRRGSWPDHAWPIVQNQRDGGLVVPNLDLGSAALDPVRAMAGA
jgi:hypothetical protein